MSISRHDLYLISKTIIDRSSYMIVDDNSDDITGARGCNFCSGKAKPTEIITHEIGCAVLAAQRIMAEI
jgi:hypothetical protein